jgi:predicted Zn-ribbon and HTH transcriptional regulator
MTIHTCPTCGNDAIEGTRFACTQGHTWTTAQWLAGHSAIPDRKPATSLSHPRRCQGCGGFMGGELGSTCGRCLLAKNTHENRGAVAVREA